VILPKPKMKEAEIQEVVSTKQGWLYFDPTLYNAIEISRIESNWLDEIEKGGLWIFPILFFALLSVLVAISKFFQIYTVRRPSLAQLKELSENLQKGDRNTLEQLEVLKIKGPIGEMLQTFVKYSGERKELIEEILYERLLEAQSSLERFLPLIAITMATAPLLGLLGTVTGMIETFKQIMLFGSSDMGNLAGGISEALVTTKYGLVSAIPALIIHSLLTRKVQGILSDMEKMGSSLLNTMQVKENASVDP
jgi:biopolymer transport protein ExbB